MTYGLHEGPCGRLYILLPWNGVNNFGYFNVGSPIWNSLPPLPGRAAGVGSNLCYLYWQDPPYPPISVIFCTKGNNTNEFWCYDISNNEWQRLEDIPGPVYQGSGMALATGDIGSYYGQLCANIYLLKGVTEPSGTNSEFYVYHFPLPIYPQGRNNWNPWERLPHFDGDHGSGADLTYRVSDNSLYAFQGNQNSANGVIGFWKYNISTRTWTRLSDYNNPRAPGAYQGSALGTWGVAGNEMIPQPPPMHDNIIYAFRGGGSRIFDAYSVPDDIWNYDLPDVPSWLAERIYHGSDLACGYIPFSGMCYMYAIFGEGYPNNPNYNVGAFWPGEDQPSGGQAVLSKISEQEMVRLSPNPVSEKVTFQFLVPHTSNTTVKIFDCSGKLINLISCPVQCQEVVWDTKNAKGEMVSSGIYFYSVKMEKKVAFGKVIIQR